jgi:hypothetical protein
MADWGNNWLPAGVRYGRLSFPMAAFPASFPRDLRISIVSANANFSPTSAALTREISHFSSFREVGDFRRYRFRYFATPQK